MEDEFDKTGFHSEISEKVSEINAAFSEVLELFKETSELVSSKEDIQFAGGGIHGIMDLFDQFNHRLQKMDQRYLQKFGELQVHEDRMQRFEKMVLDSLDEIPITDAFDER